MTDAALTMTQNVATRELSRVDILSPSQQLALSKLERMIAAVPIIGLTGALGCGKSTVLRELARRNNGIVITAADMADAARGEPAAQFETAIGEMIAAHMRETRLVVVDDLRFLVAPGANAANRPGFVRMVMLQLRMLAAALGHKLVFAGHVPENWETATDQFGAEAGVVNLAALGMEDYAAIGTAVAGAERVVEVEFAKVHRFAGHLNGYQLKLAFAMLAELRAITTDDVIASLKDYVMVSNIRVAEVEDVSFDRLPGHEHIVEALKTNIVIPMEHPELARSMGLRPKRGVLLFGPAGTGKTSIGRALAHHMRGKFFLIDGTFVSEPAPAFFGKLERVVQEAKENAPSVLFIDDADVLFQISHIAGLSRYLLSMLDGIESETTSGVCVMMTAMNVRPIPEALLRSGRIELWLETRAPDLATRESIIRRWTDDVEGPLFDGFDHAALAAATDGFTPADLRRLIGDGKARIAADMVFKRPLVNTIDYFRTAAAAMVVSRNRMAEVLGDQQLRLPPSTFEAAVPIPTGGA